MKELLGVFLCHHAVRIRRLHDPNTDGCVAAIKKLQTLMG